MLACFGDPGLAALKEISQVPVVGMADASILQACALGNRFSIVTGGERWKSMLEEFVAGHGLSVAARLGAHRGADRRRHRAQSEGRDGAAGQGLQRLRARGRRRRRDPGRRGPGRARSQAEDDGRCPSARRRRLRDLDGRGPRQAEARQGHDGALALPRRSTASACRRRSRSCSDSSRLKAPLRRGDSGCRSQSDLSSRAQRGTFAAPQDDNPAFI